MQTGFEYAILSVRHIKAHGKTKFAYSWKLISTDKIPARKRHCIALGDKIKQIQKDHIKIRGSCLMYIQIYLNALAAYCPDLENRFACGAGKEQIQEFEGLAGAAFPAEYYELYQAVNGENQYMASVLGFELLSIQAAQEEYRVLLDCPYQVLSAEEGRIKEGEYRRGWIPIAHDGGGSFILMDLEPGKNGKYGQIITLDREDDISYVLGDSLELVFKRMEELLKNGIFCYLQENEGHFQWKDGHLFNSLELYFGDKTEDEWIPVEGYFEKQLHLDVKDHRISKKALARYKRLYLMSGSDEGFDTVSLDPLRHMVNLKEVVLQLKADYSLEPLKELHSLQKLVIVFKDLDQCQMKLLASLPVKNLRFAKLNISGIDGLAVCQPLKALAFSRVTGITQGELRAFRKLTILELDETPLDGYDFLEDMTRLKTLEIQGQTLEHLNFLHKMKGLSELHIDTRARDESGLSYLADCRKLKVLDYPIAELRIAAGCPALTSLTVDGRDAVHAEALKGSKITSVTMINSDRVLEEIKEYCKLTTWGHRGL